MNKRMAGIILMSAGVLLFIIGITVYKSAKSIAVLETDTRISKNNSPDSVQTSVPSYNTVPQNPSPTSQDKGTDKIGRLVQLAIADGTLTNNERLAIKEIAEENNLNYDKIISEVEKKLLSKDFESETEIIDYDKKNGYDFEKFVIQKFSKNFFKVKNWAGDKYVNGVYAETNMHPDILLDFKLGEETSKLSVECKWRKNLYKGGIEIADLDQLERYKKFEKEQNLPVFLAVGLGGKGESPERLFVVPLRRMNSNFMYIKELEKYEKDISKNFFFDNNNNILK